MFRLEFSAASSCWGGAVEGCWILICDSVCKAELLLDHLDSKPSREFVDLLRTYHSFLALTTFAIRSCEIRHFFLYLNSIWWH